MAAAILIFLAWLGSVAAVMAWMRRAPDPREGGRRLGLFLLGVAALTVALGIWWTPRPGLVAAVAEARREKAGRLSGRIDCASAERARTLLNEMSEGQIEIGTDARLRLPAGLWGDLGAARRDALVTVAARAGECAGAGAPGVRVIDLVSGEVLEAAARPGAAGR